MRCIYISITLAVIIAAIILFVPSTITYEQEPPRNSWPFIEIQPVPSVEPIKDEILPLPQIKATSTDPGVSGEVILARVTGYNTLEAQTDSTPCIAASGDNICGRDDVVACPVHIPLGTSVEIAGKIYECLDRTHPKYGDRFDISFDKDYYAALAWGIRTKEVRILDV